MKTSRNSLCPCGSGKKYKYCCLEEDNRTRLAATSSAVAEEVRQKAQETGAESLEDLNRIAQKISGQCNQKALDDFLGLSPEQMSKILYQPFNSPELVSFSNLANPGARFLTLFDQLVSAIDEKGLKATAKGNLPLQLCKTIYDNYDDGLARYRLKLRSEYEFEALNTVRLCADLAGLIKLRKGRFYLTRACRALLKVDRRGELYLTLFKAYTTTFNWEYRDHYPSAEIIQMSFLFTLYMLTCFGEQERQVSYYEDFFIKAFPMVINEMDESDYFTPESQARSIYTLRALERFAYFFGLVEFTAIENRDKFSQFSIKKTPQLDLLLKFYY